MTAKLGIRREDKNQWEQRTPIIPIHVKKLIDKYGIHSVVQPSKLRTFSDEVYQHAGGTISEDLSDCSVVFAVKEIPMDLFEQEKTYVFFAHVIKGQEYNMPMLRHLMKKRCTLIDYEKIVDENNRRLIFFGIYAGIAGMVDTLHSLGQRWKQQGISTPFAQIKRTYEYKDLIDLKEQMKLFGDKIRNEGLSSDITPLFIGFAGYGNVSRGAQEILDLLPCKELTPQDLLSIRKEESDTAIYKIIFKEEDMVQPNDITQSFDLQEYYNHPDRYHSIFHQYLPNLTILMNCIYWDERYPRLVTKEQIKRLYTKNMLHLQVIGDISVDINGGVELTTKVTTPDHPSYIYQPATDSIIDNLSKEGVAIMAVDNLPCELPKESSEEFSTALYPFISDIVTADYTKSFVELSLPPEIKNAVILHKGKLTPSYEYLQKFL